MSDTPSLHPDTLAVLAGRGDHRAGAPVNVPVHFTSTYHPGGQATYAREGNPSWDALELTLGALEGGQALVFASGMAALSAVLEELEIGAAVVAPADAYTGTRGYLTDAAQRRRLQVRLVEVTDTDQTLQACEGAALLWLESPTNPLLGVADIAALARGARARGCRLVVDNTFATPLLQQPLALGADLVVHSATKFIAGHSDVLLGAVVANDPALVQRLQQRRTLLGSVAGPMEAFLTLRGLRTLPVRLARAQPTAAMLAERLQAHPAVTRVRYPGLAADAGHERAARQMRGFGAVVSFELPDAAAAERVCAATRVITHTTSLGGVETTMERRRRHPNEHLTPEGLVRISAGCEHPDDVWADLEQALARR